MSALDGVLDGALLSFAAWTIWYEISMAADFRLWWAARVWLLFTVIVLALCALRAVRTEKSSPELKQREERPRASRKRALVPVWVVLLVVVLLVLVTQRDHWGVVPIVVVASGVLVAGLARRFHQPGVPARPGGRHDGQAPSLLEHAVAGGSCAGLALISLFVLKPDADDVYYVNRATWVAEHGSAPVHDTMFGPGIFPSSYGGGLPLSSVESLFGAVGHVLHLSGATASYLVAAPLLAAASGWATWRLVRVWAPRQKLLVHLGAVAFMIFSAESVVGSYSIERIWQGKVAAFVILIPLIWYHLSTLAVRHSTWSQAILFAAGISFVGLTSTAALLAPVIVAAALLAAWILRSRSLAAGAVLLLIAPVVAGAAVALGPTDVGGPEPTALSGTAAFQIMLGTTVPMIVLGLLGVVLAVWLVPGRAAVVAACGSLATMVVLLPGVFQVVNLATGAGPIVWRLLLGVPTWVLVGNLLSVVRDRSGTSTQGGSTQLPVAGRRLALSAGLVAVLLTAGTPLWSSDVGARITTHPTWKVDQAALDDLHSASGVETGPGLWLMPPSQMEVLAIRSTTRFAVVPRYFYFSALRASPAELRDRLILYREVSGAPQPPKLVRRALMRLEVSLACVSADDSAAAHSLARAVRGKLRPVGDMSCHVGLISRRSQ